VWITRGLVEAAKIKSWNLFSSKMTSFKQDSDLVLNRVCSNFASNSRSSMLVTPSLGKERYLSKRKVGLIGLSFLLCTSFSGSDTWVEAYGFGFLLV
jgi:hypothetical protein